MKLEKKSIVKNSSLNLTTRSNKGKGHLANLGVKVRKNIIEMFRLQNYFVFALFQIFSWNVLIGIAFRILSSLDEVIK